MGSVFLDTNILLYAALGMVDTPDRWAIARDIVLREDYVTSGQVLAEFYANAIKKGSTPLKKDVAKNWVYQISRKPCQTIDSQLVLAAIDLSNRYKISYWDGAIIAAAERLGAKTLYTDDLSHGQAYGTVTAINPFLTSEN